MRHAVHLAVACGVLALAAACGGGSSKPNTQPAGIVLSATSDEVVVGFTLGVVATVSGGSAEPLVWCTSCTHVATVDQEGHVLGCAPGTLTVTARSPQTGEQGALALRVVPDAAFNTTLPSDADPFQPALVRTNTVERCEAQVQVSGIAATVREAHHRRYHRLELPQAGVLGQEGRPELPFYSLFYVIPVEPETQAPATWHVEVERSSPRRYEGIRPWPQQPPWWLDEEPESEAPPPFVVDEAAYVAEAPWPDPIWSAEAVQVGNLPLLHVQFAPASYLPSEGVLEHYQDVRVRVSFQGQGMLAMPRPVGDYKGTEEQSGDQTLLHYVQNADLLQPIGAADLVAGLPPLDRVYCNDLPFDLLIVTHDDLRSSAIRLARHRQDQGIRVWLETATESTLASAESVRNRIRYLDETNRLEATGDFRPHALRAVLLFGDVEYIPTFEGRLTGSGIVPTSADDEDVYVVGTDFPYSLLRGGLDWRPDVSLGRIPVDTDDQGQIVVDKIEAYENRPAGARPHHVAIYGYFDDEAEERAVLMHPMFTFTHGSTVVTASGDPGFSFDDHVEVGDLLRFNAGDPANRDSWCGRVASIEGDELQLEEPWTEATVTRSDIQFGYRDGQDDWMFLQTAERVFGFMTDIGVSVRWGYESNTTFDPGPAPARDIDGNLLRADLLGYAWDCAPANIRDNWREGLDGIVLHSDHGAPTGWNHPWFRNLDVPAFLEEGAWPPIVFSINCNSGFFDSETDTRWTWNPTGGPTHTGAAEQVPTDGTSGYGTHDVAFCEAVLRRQDGGGVAVVAASRGTTSDYNDKLVDGLFGALYVEYVRGVIVEGPGTRYAYEYLGDIVRAAKFTMFHSIRSLGGASKYESAMCNMEVYHLFGDPMLRVRPPQPGP